jgi:hypothetical protein
MYVQFSDSTKDEIVSAFGCPQDPEVWPNQGQIDPTDARWTTFAAKFPASAFGN